MSQNEDRAKNANTWDLQDLEALVGAEEGTYLEFKKPSEFMKDGKFSWDIISEELAETVSAFLNSDGGTILIGVQTDKDNRDKKVERLRNIKIWAQDQTFENLKVSLTTSQVRDRIYGNIMQRPLGVEVKELTVPVGEHATCVFVVTVPRSNLGAHQSAISKRYYRRTSDGDTPMLDYEIRDINGRRAGPQLYLECKILPTSPAEQNEWKTSSTRPNTVQVGDTEFAQVKIMYAVSNFGRGTANIVRFDIGIPEPWKVFQFSPEGTNIGATWVHNNALRFLVGDSISVFTSEVYGSIVRDRVSEQSVIWLLVIYNGDKTPAHPIWPMIGRVAVGELGLRIPSKAISSSPRWWLPFRIYTEGMSETRGAALIQAGSGNQIVRMSNYEIDKVNWCGAKEDQMFDELKLKFKLG
jgi:hypothetical protein